MTTANQQTEAPARLSPLHHKHEALGARFMALAGWRVPEAYTSTETEVETVRERLGVSDISPAGKIMIKGAAANELLALAIGDVPQAPGRSMPAVLRDEVHLPVGAGYAARLAETEFFVVTPPGVKERIAQRLEQYTTARGFFVTMADRTSELAGLIVAGPASRKLLTKLCALPLTYSTFPDQHVAQTSLAKVHTVVVRRDLDTLPAYELYFQRPYAEYVWDTIVDAGSEFGIIAFGQQATAMLNKSAG